MDEKSKQLLAQNRTPMATMKPGRPERWDYEYSGKGTRNIFLAVESKAGTRTVRARGNQKDRLERGIYYLLYGRLYVAQNVALKVDHAFLMADIRKDLVDDFTQTDKFVSHLPMLPFEAT